MHSPFDAGILRILVVCLGGCSVFGCASSDPLVEQARAAEESVERIVVPPPGELAQRPFSMTNAWVMNDLLFDEGETSLNTAGRELLRELVDWLARNAPRSHVRIYGHTDAVGSAVENLRVSRLRGESVRTYLLDEGVSPDRVVVVPVGENAPTRTNDTSHGRSANRRVVILVVSDPDSSPQDR